jgi:hypothetical protein
MKEGEYTIVATADMLRDNEECHWTYENAADLNRFTIKNLGKYIDYEHAVLGIYKEDISIGRGTGLNISLKPAGSLVTMHLTHINAGQVAALEYTWDKSNINYLVIEDKPNLQDIKEKYSYTTDPQYTGLYAYYYFLPVQDFKFSWSAIRGTSTVVNRGSVTFDIQKGVNKTITAFVDNYDENENTTVDLTTKGAIFNNNAANAQQQILEVGKADFTN